MRARRLQQATFCLGMAIFWLVGGGERVAAQSAKIEWEVANRFRLFADQAAFEQQVNAYKKGGSASVLAMEHTLVGMIPNTPGHGWARQVRQLCVDALTGRVIDPCQRDGDWEDFITPKDARIRLWATLPPDFADANCTWTIGKDGKPFTRSCREQFQQRVALESPIPVAVVARTASNATLEATTTVEARDVLIVGMGDSIASGEGNPSEPVQLADTGFCFQRPISRRLFYLPGRARATGVDASCENLVPGEQNDQRDRWDAAAARWMFAPCHRSLYSYQVRAALTLAIENPAISVTFVPLGCTGAEIPDVTVREQKARERPKIKNQKAVAKVPAQISELSRLLRVSKKNRTPVRRPDLILLTIGANDIGFSGLVADIVLREGERERGLLSSLIVRPDTARSKLQQLGEQFKHLRRSLLTFTDGDLERVVFATYPNPGLHDGGDACPSTLRGFDASPAIGMDGRKLDEAVRFVEKEFIPTLRNYVTCDNGGMCTDAKRERMTYVDAFRTTFGNHGFCARSDDDPVFDNTCFVDGDSFQGREKGLQDPLVCQLEASRFAPYAKRARWIRTVNDSYFTAMTYPAGGPGVPTDLHDARWGLMSIFYGGAMHPTAEGHAAIADGVLPDARRILKLPAR